MSAAIFKSNVPNGLSILVDTDGVTAIAMTIQVTDCNNRNASDVLKNLNFVNLTFGTTQYTFNLSNNNLEGSTHYSYDISPGLIIDTSLITPNPTTDCYDVATIPTVTHEFENTDYDNLQGEATELRKSSFIFEVDRNENSINPTNFDAIVGDYAVRAEVQDSNYSSRAFIASRYAGSKIVGGRATVDDPALQFRTLEVAIFPSGSSAVTLLSASENGIIRDEQYSTLYYTPDKVAGIKNSSGSFYMDQNNPQTYPNNGQKIYEEINKNYVPLGSTTFLLPDLDIVYTSDSYGILTMDPSTDPALQGVDLNDNTVGQCYSFTNLSDYYEGELRYLSSSNGGFKTVFLDPQQTYTATVYGSNYTASYANIKALTYAEAGVCPAIDEGTFSGGWNRDDRDPYG
jgi:hypothetical protein